MLARALLSFLVLPGVVAGLIPALVLGGRFQPGPAAPAGGALMAIGAGLLLWCVRDFYLAGQGSLAPWDPPKRLVVVGLYRLVRNPMYVAVLILVGGWAVTFSSGTMAIYLAILGLVFHLRVRRGEEPKLCVRFGAEWDTYCRHVARWLPRLKPWRVRAPPGYDGKMAN